MSEVKLTRYSLTHGIYADPCGEWIMFKDVAELIECRECTFPEAMCICGPKPPAGENQEWLCMRCNQGVDMDVQLCGCTGRSVRAYWVPYAPRYDEAQLAELGEKGKSAWASVPSISDFMKEMRGDDDDDATPEKVESTQPRKEGDEKMPEPGTHTFDPNGPQHMTTPGEASNPPAGESTVKAIVSDLMPWIDRADDATVRKIVTSHVSDLISSRKIVKARSERAIVRYEKRRMLELRLEIERQQRMINSGLQDIRDMAARNESLFQRNAELIATIVNAADLMRHENNYAAGKLLRAAMKVEEPNAPAAWLLTKPNKHNQLTQDEARKDRLIKAGWTAQPLYGTPSNQ